jgi:hypothetical protein
MDQGCATATYEAMERRGVLDGTGDIHPLIPLLERIAVALEGRAARRTMPEVTPEQAADYVQSIAEENAADPARLWERAAAEMRNLTATQEEVCKAFLAKYGLDPKDCIIIQQTLPLTVDGGGGWKWFLREMTVEEKRLRDNPEPPLSPEEDERFPGEVERQPNSVCPSEQTPDACFDDDARCILLDNADGWFHLPLVSHDKADGLVRSGYLEHRGAKFIADDGYRLTPKGHAWVEAEKAKEGRP